MSKCEICGKDSASKCCSGACRAKLSRRTRTVVDERTRTAHGDVTPEVLADVDEACGEPATLPDSMLTKASLADYNAHRDRYATRANPDSLNWGPYMDAAQLKQADLTANRVTIPGDYDYEVTLMSTGTGPL